MDTFLKCCIGLQSSKRWLVTKTLQETITQKVMQQAGPSSSTGECMVLCASLSPELELVVVEVDVVFELDELEVDVELVDVYVCVIVMLDVELVDVELLVEVLDEVLEVEVDVDDDD